MSIFDCVAIWSVSFVLNPFCCDKHECHAVVYDDRMKINACCLLLLNPNLHKNFAQNIEARLAFVVVSLCEHCSIGSNQ